MYYARRRTSIGPGPCGLAAQTTVIVEGAVTCTVETIPRSGHCFGPRSIGGVLKQCPPFVGENRAGAPIRTRPILSYLPITWREVLEIVAPNLTRLLFSEGRVPQIPDGRV